MTLKERFDSLKEAKKTPETLALLKALDEEVTASGDKALAWENSQSIVELMRFLRMHKEAIEWLEAKMNSDFFSTKDLHLKVVDELVRTLLRTEDFVKLESVLQHRERYLTNDHQKVMQKFYYAVCYEGMKANSKAIASLEGIKDTISASNLVSKYLKLSMLHLKEGHLQKAKENFEHAILFDRRQQNPIFCLAESDILYYEGHYAEALAKYQEYFIKSKNKHRYLDRYIRINMKLGHLDEAWRFYREYLPQMGSIVSKNYRLVFYEAGLELAKELGDKAEILNLESQIDALAPEAPVLNRFDGVYRLLSVAFQAQTFRKDREIIHHLFKALDELGDFQKLVYVKKDGDLEQLYHFSKGLLLEKSLDSYSMDLTLIRRILTTRPVNDLYGYEDLIQYHKDPYLTVDTRYVFANGINRGDRLDYFIVYTKDEENFDAQQKLVLLATEILKKQLYDFDTSLETSSLVERFKALIEETGDGLIRIENNTLHLLNDAAKKWLQLTTDMIDFDRFRALVTPEVFLDDFLHTKRLLLTLKKSGKSLCFLTTSSDVAIYALIEEAKDAVKPKMLNPFLGLPNELQLLLDNNQIEAKTVMLIDLRDYLDDFKTRGYEAFQVRLNEMIDFIKTTTRHHFDGLYQESIPYFYLTLKTTDKRVIQRITDALSKAFEDLCLRFATVQVNHSLSYEKLIQLRYLDSLTEETKPLYVDHRNFRYNQELAKTIRLNAGQLIEKKYVPLAYQAIGDWSSNQVVAYLVSVSPQAMLGEDAQLTKVIRSSDLEIPWDQLMAQSLAKELKAMELTCEIVLPIAMHTFLDKKAITKLLSRRQGLNLCLSLDLSESFDKVRFIEMADLLKDKSVRLYATKALDNLRPGRLDVIERLDRLVVTPEDLELPHFESMLLLLKTLGTDLVLSHGSKTLRKSVLERFGIQHVFGDAFPKYESVTALKK